MQSTCKGMEGVYVLVPSSHDRKRRSCKRMNRAGKGKYFKREEGIFVLLIIAENNFEESGLKLESMYGLGNRYIIKRSDVSFKTTSVENTVLERSGSMMTEPRLKGVLHVSET